MWKVSVLIGVLATILIAPVTMGAESACTVCRSTGKVRCKLCNASTRSDSGGIIPCPTCMANGRIRDSFGATQICSQCKGAKAFRCNECNQGWKPCGVCSGKGTVIGGEIGSGPSNTPNEEIAKMELRCAKLKVSISQQMEIVEKLRKELSDLENILSKLKTPEVKKPEDTPKPVEKPVTPKPVDDL